MKTFQFLDINNQKVFLMFLLIKIAKDTTFQIQNVSKFSLICKFQKNHIKLIDHMLKIAFRFSDFAKKVPLVNLQPFLNNKPSVEDCKAVRDAFHHYGCIIVNDPRIKSQKNDKFLDLMEAYFSKRQSQLDSGNKQDVYEELSYQVGLTPPFVQTMEDQSETMSAFTGVNKPLTPVPSKPLSRMRFFWNVGTVTPDIPQNKIPKDFPQMEHVLNDWGDSTHKTLFTVSEMLALGLDLPKQTFTEMLKGGASKLAPLANDLRRIKLGEPFIDFHFDFTYMTIHGKNRFPGLSIWLKNGQKIKVAIPKGYIFLQAGSQLQRITGGYILNGYHEAINTEQVQQRAQQAIKEGREPWRITSTVFSHLRGDVPLEPIGKYATEQAKKKYGSIKQAEYMKQLIQLRQKKVSK